MENNRACTDQASDNNGQGNSVNGIKTTSKVFVGQSSPIPVAYETSVKPGTSFSGGKEDCGLPFVLSLSRTETSEFMPTSTPSDSRAGGEAASSSCATPASDGHARKTVYSRNVTSVDRRSNEIRSSMKSSPSAVSSCSPASLSNGNHGSNGSHDHNLSPGCRSNGKSSAGLSTSDSIFTYSLTDDSHDELDEIDSRGDMEKEAKKTLDATNDVKSIESQEKSNIPVPCDNNNFVDKLTQVKNVIEKEYVHTIVYTFDELTSFEKNTSMMLSETCQSSPDEQLQQKLKKNPKTSSTADQKEHGHKKFSSRSVKDFLRSMSPASRHRKPLKSSESISSKSNSTLAGSLDSASVSEDLEETGASWKTTPKNTVSLKKSPAIGKKSPADSSHSPHEQKSKILICDPATSN